MNFLQICNRVKQNCGISGSDYVTMQNATGEQLRVANWVNQKWLDLQTKNQDWEWLRKSFTFPTVTGQYLYTAAQIGITDFGLWARDTFRNYANPVVQLSIGSPCVANLLTHNLNSGDTIQFQTTGVLPTGVLPFTTYYMLSAVDANNFTFSATFNGPPVSTTGSQSGVQTMTSSNTTSFVGFKSEVFMEYDEYDSFRNSYIYGALRQIETRPLNVTITPSKALGLGPFPVVGYTIVGDYYSVPSIMMADTDIPALPAKYHLAIVGMAMKSYGNYEAAPDVLSEANEIIDAWMPRIDDDQLQEVGSAGALC